MRGNLINVKKKKQSVVRRKITSYEETSRVATANKTKQNRQGGGGQRCTWEKRKS